MFQSFDWQNTKINMQKTIQMHPNASKLPRAWHSVFIQIKHSFFESLNAIHSCVNIVYITKYDWLKGTRVIILLWFTFGSYLGSFGSYLLKKDRIAVYKSQFFVTSVQTQTPTPFMKIMDCSKKLYNMESAPVLTNATCPLYICWMLMLLQYFLAPMLLRVIIPPPLFSTRTTFLSETKLNKYEYEVEIINQWLWPNIFHCKLTMPVHITIFF